MHHRSHDWGGVSVQGVSVLGESLSWGVSVQGQSLSTGGCLSMEGLCPGDLCQGGSLLGRHPCTVMSRQYASYWNAFLFSSFIHLFDYHSSNSFVVLILQWSINELPPAAVDNGDRITIGLVMNLDTYTSVVEKGPPADSDEVSVGRLFSVQRAIYN